ncbi:MAG: glycosyltransferase family 87 protein [Corynebacterium sp.]|nr:glycosyltransferase family 87 protein [Corynebacterium sp.]
MRRTNILCGFFMLLAAVGFWRALGRIHDFFRTDEAFLDLATYKAAGEAWLNNGILYGNGYAGPTPFIYPPFASFLFSAYAHLDDLTVKKISLVLAWAAIALFSYFYIKEKKTAVLAFLIISGLWATVNGMTLGQIDIVLSCLIFLDVLGIIPQRFRGILLGLSAAIKISPAFYGIIFLLRKDWASALRSIITGILVTGFAFVLRPEQSKQYWFGGHWNDVNMVNDLAYGRNQSVVAILARSGISEQSLAHWQNLIWLAVLILALVGVYMWLRAGQLSIAVLCLVLGMCLGAPISNIHNWAPIMLAVPVMLQGKIFWARVAAGIAVVAQVLGYFVDSWDLRSPTLIFHPNGWEWICLNFLGISSLIALVLLVALGSGLKSQPRN